MDLSASEARVLGCLMEKQVTTPDIYPLTLNGLRLACNQSTNRDPVVDYDDQVLRDALHRLERRGWARLASGRGSRAPKYRHLLADGLPLAGDEHAMLCVLLLRGPQTPGELKQRAERMHAFADLDAVHETLERLIARRLVACLERRPGQKEERYEQLLSADGEERAPSPVVAHAAAGGNGDGRPVGDQDRLALGDRGQAPVEAGPSLGELEERIARLEREVAELRARERGVGMG
jgi:uncharacterized protein